MTQTDTAQQVLLTLHERLFRDGDFAAVDDLISDDFIWREHGLPEPPEPGREGVFEFAYLLQTAVPDWNWDIKCAVTEGNCAVVHWGFHGVNTGRLWGHEATNRHVQINGIHVGHVRDGLIRELWQSWGLVDLIRQLGIKPPGASREYPVAQFASSHTGCIR
jgi:steroid delta-isomerase-like uncharacterized protein